MNIRAQHGREALSLSDLRPWPAVPGSERGTCCVCGRDTERGHRREPSESFNAWDVVRGGTFCEWCWAMLKHRPFRMHSWVAGRDGVTFYPGPELPRLAAFLRAPALPCAVYLTRGHRKQLWVALGRRVSVDARALWVATDWAGVVMLDGAEDEPLALAERLLGRQVRRRTLFSGAPSPEEWRRAIVEGWRQDLEDAMARAGDPRWEVWVHVANRPA